MLDLVGFIILFLMGYLASLIGGISLLKKIGLETVFWALIMGLVVSNFVKVPAWFRRVIKTEVYIKTGIILMGAEIFFQTLLKAGFLGIIQAIIVIPAVFYFCYWMAKFLKIDDEFAAILGAGVSICGVSAAISAGGAIQGDPKKVSHTISLVLLCAVPMIVILPLLAKLFGLSPAVAGAWIGGTIDTTGAVAAAGEMAGKEALGPAMIVKMSQNAFIGIAAFLLAIWFSAKRAVKTELNMVKEVWGRFPKFILAFMAASILFSLFPGEISKPLISITKPVKVWLFTIAFVCVGLDTRFKELITMGAGRPALAFVMAQSFNILLTLIVASLLWG